MHELDGWVSEYFVNPLIPAYSIRDSSGYGLSQWETMLHCNIVSHWLSSYPEWSLQYWTKSLKTAQVQFQNCPQLKLCCHLNFNGLVQERRNSSALAMELHLSWTNPLIYFLKNTHNGLPIARQPRQSMACLLWVHSMVYVLPLQ